MDTAIRAIAIHPTAATTTLMMMVVDEEDGAVVAILDVPAELECPSK